MLASELPNNTFFENPDNMRVLVGYKTNKTLYLITGVTIPVSNMTNTKYRVASDISDIQSIIQEKFPKVLGKIFTFTQDQIKTVIKKYPGLQKDLNIPNDIIDMYEFDCRIGSIVRYRSSQYIIGYIAYGMIDLVNIGGHNNYWGRPTQCVPIGATNRPNLNAIQKKTLFAELPVTLVTY